MAKLMILTKLDLFLFKKSLARNGNELGNNLGGGIRRVIYTFLAVAGQVV